MNNLPSLVLDTNIVISSWFGSPGSPNKEIMMLWKNNKLSLLFSDDTISEYAEKLKSKNVPNEHLTTFITNIYKSAIHVEIAYYHLHSYPSDQDDIAFVLCAENGKANFLVSYDDHLLSLDGLYVFKICRPLEFLAGFRELVTD